MVEEFAAVGAADGTEFDDVIGFGEEIEMVLDHDDGVALVDERMEDADEFFAVAEVKTDGGLFEQVEVTRKFAAGALAIGREAGGEFGDEFEALGFAAGQRGGGLAKGEITEAAIAHQFADLREVRVEIEEVGGFLEGELKDFADGFSLPCDIGEFRAVAKTAAVVAGKIGVGHERHLELHASGAFARRAAAAGGIEGEARGRVSTNLGLGKRGEELADLVEDAEVSGGGGARRFADGGLVDFDDAFEALGAAEGFKRDFRFEI